jgi:hypothetical protein
VDATTPARTIDRKRSPLPRTAKRTTTAPDAAKREASRAPSTACPTTRATTKQVPAPTTAVARAQVDCSDDE